MLNMVKSIRSMKSFKLSCLRKSVFRINLFHTNKMLTLWNVNTYENIRLWKSKTIQFLNCLQLNSRRRNDYIKYWKGRPLFCENRQILEKRGITRKIFPVLSLFSYINRLFKVFSCSESSLMKTSLLMNTSIIDN